MRVALFGTPEFAVPVLEALIADKDTDVAAVVTQEDRPAGRKGILTAPPVKIRAQEAGIPVLQFEKINRTGPLDRLRELSCDLFVTAAFGQILGRRLLAIPPRGVVNVHGSLLPEFRGASPIAGAIRAGRDVTGVTTMYTDAGVDTGDIILQRELPILPEDTTGSLTEKMAVLGAQLLIETLHAIEAGTAPRIPQQEEKASVTPILDRESGFVDFSGTMRETLDLIRSMDPWPGTYTLMDNEKLKIFRAEKREGLSGEPGMVLEDPGKMTVAVKDGAVSLTEIQMPAKKRMRTEDFLRGHKISAGMRLGVSDG